jgi:hypothetical protein
VFVGLCLQQLVCSSLRLLCCMMRSQLSMDEEAFVIESYPPLGQTVG